MAGLERALGLFRERHSGCSTQERSLALRPVGRKDQGPISPVRVMRTSGENGSVGMHPIDLKELKMRTPTKILLHRH